MHRESVVSVSIASVGFDPATRTLEVEYKNGRIVQYSGVPADAAEDAMTPTALEHHLSKRKRPAFPPNGRPPVR